MPVQDSPLGAIGAKIRALKGFLGGSQAYPIKNIHMGFKQAFQLKIKPFSHYPKTPEIYIIYHPRTYSHSITEVNLSNHISRHRNHRNIPHRSIFDPLYSKHYLVFIHYILPDFIILVKEIELHIS